MREMPKIDKIKRLEDLPGSERWGNQSGSGWRCWFEGYERRASKRICPTLKDFLEIIGFYGKNAQVKLLRKEEKVNKNA